MAILCLDLGIRTGWAYKGSEDVVKSGVEYFPLPIRADIYSRGGTRFFKFHTWIKKILDELGDVDRVVYELVQGHRGAAASNAYGGFMAILTMECHGRGIPYSALPVKTLKRLITGRGDATKPDIMDEVRRYGYDFSDDNEADALALMIVTCYKGKST